MQTLQGVRFMPIARIDGTLLGLDERWLRGRGLVLMLLLALVTPAGPLHGDTSLPWWVRIAIGLSSVAALLLTSLGHELGHALAGRLAGLVVRAIVLGPQGSMTIRAGTNHPHLNLRTALGGPLANGVLASACAVMGVWTVPGSFAAGFLTQLSVLQLLVGLANLVPFGSLDGSHILAAWRGCRYDHLPSAA